MTHHRGFVVCRDDVLPQMRESLGRSTVFCEIIRRGGETAFAFAGRSIPDPRPEDAVVVGVDGSSGRQFFVSDYAFRPEILVPRIGLTVGIALKSADADRDQWNAFQRSLWEKLGLPGEDADNGEFAGFRWDIEYPFYERGDNVLLRKLQAIEKNLVKTGTAYLMMRFEYGWGSSSGDLGIGEDGEVDGTYLGPSAYVNLAWTDADGTENFVAANEASFEMETSTELPDSEVWSL